MKSSIALINNPVAKRASPQKLEEACRYLSKRGYSVETFTTVRKGEGTTLASEAVSRSPYLIIAAGGDGTVNEVMNGMAGSEIPMAILPLGTTNVLAKEAGIPENVEGALETALTRTPRAICLGRISFDEGVQPSRLFCLMAGVGYDGETVFRIDPDIKRMAGKGAYIWSGFRTLLSFEPSELSFHVDGKIHTGYSAIIGKAAKYGGHFMITPDAKLTDPSLYLCIFKGKKKKDFLRYVAGILRGAHLKYRDVKYLRADQIEISGKAHVQIDGDYVGMTPAKIDVVRDIIRLVF